ncbi:MAG: 7-carboxy-7-deazaguanine synthase QueE [Candidatus Omnitrophota bacterium]
MTDKAPISEIFYSLQGEGIFVGVPQVFVRFSGCNLDKCVFCDEKALQTSLMTVDKIISRVKRLSWKKRIHSVSLTGGEPLLYPQFLKTLCEKLKKEGFFVYLETNGTLPLNFREIKKYVDFTAMDIKLPSATGLKNYFTEHEEFLKSTGAKRIFVKVVVTAKTSLNCFKKAVRLVEKVNKNIPFIIQPATKTRGAGAPRKEKNLLFCDVALKSLKDARVIPQIHKIIGVK